MTSCSKVSSWFFIASMEDKSIWRKIEEIIPFLHQKMHCFDVKNLYTKKSIKNIPIVLENIYILE